MWMDLLAPFLLVQLVAHPLLEFTVALQQEYNCRGLSGHDDQLGQQWLNPSAASHGITN